MKWFNKENGRHIQDFLEMGFTKLHDSPIASTIIPAKEMNQIHEEKHFPKLDLHIGHHQFSLKEEFLQEATTCCHCGHYGSLFIAIELDNAPFTLQYYLYKVFGKQLCVCINFS